jgi:hypothetical protein
VQGAVARRKKPDSSDLTFPCSVTSTR